MDFTDYFPVWGKLTPVQQNRILGAVMTRMVKKETVIHNGSMDCTGLLLVKSGQLRAFILSEEGREITIYRLFDRDMCLFSASCMLMAKAGTMPMHVTAARASNALNFFFIIIPPTDYILVFFFPF